jgi:hypothetical protein
MLKQFVSIALITIVSYQPAFAAQNGQSVSTQYGVVSNSTEVDLDSNAVPKGALIGGTVGLLTTRRGPSRTNRTRNVVVGAAIGGAVASSGSGEKGILYDITTTTGKVQVVTDQTEIRKEDCVAIEQTGDTTNLRRVTDDHCKQVNTASAPAPASVDEVKETSEQCLAAKQTLVDAETKEQLDLAASKIKLLCNE